MEENTNVTDQTTQAENMGNETEVQGAAGERGKTFTQEEVNSFVQSRIARLRGQIEKDSKAEYEKRFAELEAREMKLMAKEKLSERGMPRELAEIITCTDEKDLENKLEALQKIYGDKAKEKDKPTGFVQIVGARPAEGNTRGGLPVGPDPVRRAMGLD